MKPLSILIVLGLKDFLSAVEVTAAGYGFYWCQVSDKDKTGLGYKAASPTVEGFVNSSKILEKQENKSDKGYHEVLSPFKGNYMPSKRDLRLIDEHFESASVDVSTVSSSDGKTVKTVDVKGMVSKEEPKPDKKNSFSPSIIDDWVSESEEEDKPKFQKQVQPSFPKIEFVKAKYQNQSFRKPVKQVNTAKGKVVVNAVKGNWFNGVKASALGSTKCDDEDEEAKPQPKLKNPKPVKETPILKPYKPKIPYPQRLRKEKMEAQYGKFLDMIRVIEINVPLVDVLAGMPNYGKFLKELISNKHKIKQISAAFLSDECSAILQNKVPPKLGDPESFLIPCNFNKKFSCNVLADIGASINLMPYFLYAKLSLKTVKPTKISVRLADKSFQYPVRIAKNMLVEVGKFTFPADFIILEMEEDIKLPLIFGRPFLHTADAVI
nr:reverse transcriptase domain-containing protein [Tanacetum cinerariifolium]